MDKLNAAFADVKEFHTAFGVETSETPKSLQLKEQLQRYTFMLEELVEFLESETIEDQADALIDLIYLAVGTFTIMGIEPQRLWEIVHHANMSKLVDGKVILDDKGKIQKPKGWEPPEKLIKTEIEAQANKNISF